MTIDHVLCFLSDVCSCDSGSLVTRHLESIYSLSLLTLNASVLSTANNWLLVKFDVNNPSHHTASYVVARFSYHRLDDLEVYTIVLRVFSYLFMYIICIVFLFQIKISDMCTCLHLYNPFLVKILDGCS